MDVDEATSHRAASGGPSGQLTVFVVTMALLALVGALVALQRYEGLAGAITAAIYGYWLPVRPNRRPSAPDGPPSTSNEPGVAA